MIHFLAAAVTLQTGQNVSFTVGTGADSQRSALVFPSRNSGQPSPLVFVYHGHSWNPQSAANTYKIQQAWPEAIVVYPQGLEVELVGRKGPGWQIAPNMNGNRDVKFFDAMMARLPQMYKVDTKRVYVCGQSNGGIFTYVLLGERGRVFAAAAPVSGFAPDAFKGAPPVPIMITHGQKDTTIPISMAEKSLKMAVANNGAGTTPKEIAPGYYSYTPSKNGNDVIWHSHNGGHSWPDGTADAVVRFFKNHSRN